MNTMLTPQILDYLMKRGYRYCLSKTASTGRDDVSSYVSLTPVTTQPNTGLLPEGYDTWFDIANEPVQMAIGANNKTLFIVKMNETDIKAYPYSLNKF